MNKGLTVVGILITVFIVALIVTGVYVLRSKSDTNTQKTEDVTEVNVDAEEVDAPEDIVEQPPAQREEPEASSTQAPTRQPNFQTSPLWQHVIENLYRTPEDSESVTEPETETTEPATPQIITVTYTNNGFSPKTATINQGDSVLFVNNSNKGMWIGSDQHPTHTQYPLKSSTDCFGSSFDSCKDIASGNSWQFQFASIGSWGYHNHSRVGKTGTIIVK